jgi:hypothetical protein
MGARPGSSFTASQQREISVFVSNACEHTVGEMVKIMEETLRDFYGNLVEHGCLVPEGVAKIAAIHAQRAAEQAAELAAQQPAAEASGAAPEPRLILSEHEAATEPPDLTSPTIQ